MAELTENQARGFLKRFDEIRDECNVKSFNKAKKIIEKFEKSQRKPLSLPWIELYKAALAQGMDQIEEAAELCKQIAEKKPKDARFVNAFIQVYRSIGCDEECIPFFKQLVDEKPKHQELLHHYINVCLISAAFKEAQETAMALVRIPPVEQDTYLLCAACCYYRACAEKNAVFYKFAISFFGKCKLAHWDTIFMLFQSHMMVGQADKALALVQSKEIQEIMSYDKLGIARLEIEALIKLEKYEEAGKCAENVLRTINADSLEEWRVVVQHSPDAQKIINEHSSNGKLRGPKIAQIDLAKKEGKDIVPLLLSYANERPNAAYLFGDLNKYFTEDLCGKLSEINDQALHAYVTGEFKGDVQDSRTAIIKAETLLSLYAKGDKSKLTEAIAICAKYPEAPECMLMFIRLSALMGATSYLGQSQQKLKLEAISFLSAGNIFLQDILTNVDIKELVRLSAAINDYTYRSISGFNYYFKNGIDEKHFLPLQQTTTMRKQIMNHRIRYFAKIIQLWLALLLKDPLANEARINGLVSNEAIDKMVNIVDETALPLFCKGIHDLIYPEATTMIKAVSSIVRFIVGKDDESRTAALKDIPVQYEAFVVAVNSNFTKIETDNLFIIASIALAANKLGKKAEPLNGILDAFNAEKTKEIESYPSPMDSTIAEQKERLSETIKHIRALL